MINDREIRSAQVNPGHPRSISVHVRSGQYRTRTPMQSCKYACCCSFFSRPATWLPSVAGCPSIVRLLSPSPRGMCKHLTDLSITKTDVRSRHTGQDKECTHLWPMSLFISLYLFRWASSLIPPSLSFPGTVRWCTLSHNKVKRQQVQVMSGQGQVRSGQEGNHVPRPILVFCIKRMREPLDVARGEIPFTKCGRGRAKHVRVGCVMKMVEVGVLPFLVFFAFLS